MHAATSLSSRPAVPAVTACLAAPVAAFALALFWATLCDCRTRTANLLFLVPCNPLLQYECYSCVACTARPA